MTREQPSKSSSKSVVDRRPARGQFVCTVAGNVPLCREHYRLVLRVDHFPATRPGQFIQISCRDLHEDYAREVERDLGDWDNGPEHGVELRGPLALLGRPFSLAGRREVSGGGVVDV